MVKNDNDNNGEFEIRSNLEGAEFEGRMRVVYENVKANKCIHFHLFLPIRTEDVKVGDKVDVVLVPDESLGPVPPELFAYVSDQTLNALIEGLVDMRTRMREHISAETKQ